MWPQIAGALSIVGGLSRIENLKPLNQRWEAYAREAMRSAANPEDAASQLDLHGCWLAVKQHRNAQLIGEEGIVVRYSTQAFHIVSTRDRLRVLPRLKDCEFQVKLDQRQVVSLTS